MIEILIQKEYPAGVFKDFKKLRDEN